MKRPTRSRAANRVFRRQQLIDATIESISAAGFAGTTLARVADIAGVSQGIVVFHFGTKERLLLATLKFLIEEYGVAWRTALAEVGQDPVERLCAFVLADLQPRLVSRKKLTVWHAFYGEARAHPVYLDICGAADSEHSATLRDLVAGVAELGPSELDTTATAIESLSDGVWLRMLLSDHEFDRDAAHAVLAHQLECLFPAHALRMRQCFELQETRPSKTSGGASPSGMPVAVRRRKQYYRR